MVHFVRTVASSLRKKGPNKIILTPLAWKIHNFHPQIPSHIMSNRIRSKSHITCVMHNQKQSH